MPISSTTSSSTSTISTGSNEVSASKSTSGDQGVGFQLLIDQSSSGAGTAATGSPSTNTKKMLDANRSSAGASSQSGDAAVQQQLTSGGRRLGPRSDRPAANPVPQGGQLSLMAEFVVLNASTPARSTPGTTLGSLPPQAPLTGTGPAHGAPVLALDQATPGTTLGSLPPQAPLTGTGPAHGAPVLALDQATPGTTLGSLPPQAPLTGTGPAHGAPISTEATSSVQTAVSEVLAHTTGGTTATAQNRSGGSAAAASADAGLPGAGVASATGKNQSLSALSEIATSVPVSMTSISPQGQVVPGLVASQPLGAQAGIDAHATQFSSKPSSAAGVAGDLGSARSPGRNPSGSSLQPSQVGAFEAATALPPTAVGLPFASGSLGGVASEMTLPWSGGSPGDLGVLASVVSAHISTNPSLPSTLHLRLSPGDLGTLEVVMSSNSSGLQIHMAASTQALASVLNHSANDLTAHLHAALGVAVHLELGGFGSGAGSNSGEAFAHGRSFGARGVGSSSLDGASIGGSSSQGVESSQVDPTRLLDVRM